MQAGSVGLQAVQEDMFYMQSSFIDFFPKSNVMRRWKVDGHHAHATGSAPRSLAIGPGC